jgi:hypothetical protein
VSQTLSLANTGNAPVNGLALIITGDFAITTPCPLTILALGASCAVTITFSPTATGARTGSLTVSATGQTPINVPLSGTGIPSGAFALTVNGGSSASVSVSSGEPASYSLSLTPQNGFTGTVIFNCTPVNPGQYATCSLLPSSVSVTNATPQTSAATINTVTETTTALRSSSFSTVAVCALPGMLIAFFHKRLTLARSLVILLASTTLFAANGCGSGGNVTINNVNSNLRYTPPGTYQYQVTATSASGVQLTQSVTLNLTVTQ